MEERILRRIYDGFDVSNDILSELFFQTLDELNSAVDEGLPSPKWGEENKAFVDALKYNNAVFSAFKTHREQNDLHRLLLDENGKQKDFARFRRDTETVIGDYNSNWLKTEYDTAVKNARTAAQFADYEQDEDLYPNLKWLPSSAVEPRAAHMVYYNTIRSLRDGWWVSHYPGCLWGCQCDTTSTADPITHQGDTPVAVQGKDTGPAAAPGLDHNPYYTKSIFSRTHPYVTDAYLPEKKLRKLLIPIVKKLLKK